MNQALQGILKANQWHMSQAHLETVEEVNNQISNSHPHPLSLSLHSRFYLSEAGTISLLLQIGTQRLKEATELFLLIKQVSGSTGLPTVACAPATGPHHFSESITTRWVWAKQFIGEGLTGDIWFSDLFYPHSTLHWQKQSASISQGTGLGERCLTMAGSLPFNCL